MNSPLLFFISNGELIFAIPQLTTSLEQLDYPQYCEYPYCGFTASTRPVALRRVPLLCLYGVFSYCTCTANTRAEPVPICLFFHFLFFFSFYPSSCCSFLGSMVRPPVRPFLRTFLSPIDRSLVWSFVCQ